MPLDTDWITIRNALCYWCFEERVEDVQRFEIYFLSQELVALGWPNLGGAGNRGEPEPLIGISRDDALYHLGNAWTNLLLDFTQRVARGKIHVRGVQSKPVRGMMAVSIWAKWAADFRVDPLRDTIEFDEYRYIDVAASLVPGVTQASASEILLVGYSPLAAENETAAGDITSVEAATTQPLAAEVIEPVPTTKGDCDLPRRRRGRANCAPQIEADLRANWDAVQRRATTNEDGRPNWTELADAIYKRLAKARGNAGKQMVPHKNTIRKRLPQIYWRLLDDKTAR